MRFQDRDNIAIVLAAGKGVRMKSDIPKVLHPLSGKPLILYVIENLRQSGIDNIIVVVGYKGEMVIDTVGDSVEYVWQYEQLGTGHAVMQTEQRLNGYKGSVLIACGDVPLINTESFKSMIELSKQEKTKAVVLTMIQNNPFGYGRIVKDQNDNIIKIIEEKDASSEEKLVKEVNTGTYIFDNESLFVALKTLGRDNAQGEYYLTDTVSYIHSSGYDTRSVVLKNSIEGCGINSREDLKKLENYLNS